MKMQRVILEKPGIFSAEEVDFLAAPGPLEVSLKMHRLGVCGTDLHAFKGRQPFFTYPRVLGHEVAAEVIAIGDQVTHVKIGDLCTIMPYRNVDVDQAVRRGKTNCGSSLRVLGVHEDGAMQSFFTYPADLVFPAHGLHLDQIALIEPLAIGSHAVDRAGIQSDDLVLVIGAGPIGIGTVAMARLKGVKIVVMDVDAARLEFIRQKFPLVATILVSDQVEDSLRAEFGGDLPTVILDATGNKSSMEQCLDYIAPSGTIVFIGLFIGDLNFHDPLFHRKEVTIKASRNALAKDFQELIRLLRAGDVTVDDMITHRIRFEDLVDEFEKLYLPSERVIKAVIEF